MLSKQGLLKRGFCCALLSLRSNLIFKSTFATQAKKPKILITGSLGQIGIGLANNLRNKYGVNQVLMSDIIRPSNPIEYFEKLDVLDMTRLEEIIKREGVTRLIHLGALLSAAGEKNVQKALQLNVGGLHNVLELSRVYNLEIFIPSTIGAFGPSTPRTLTPNLTIQRPTSIYGVTKVYTELLGEYYHKKFGVDFRCLRFPGIISHDTKPGGGTTDYACQIFVDALNGVKHECYLKADTFLPMMYIDDCLRSIEELMDADASCLKTRTYNVTALSFSPSQIHQQLAKHFPNFEIVYRPDSRQQIADSWPMSLDDSEATKDWGWQSQIKLEEMVTIMLNGLTSQNPQAKQKHI